MQTSTPFRLTVLASSSILALSLAGCAVGPAYQRPSAPESIAFKELEGWVPAAPADALERGPWWQLFGDPVPDQLVAGVEVSNQNAALAAANYAQARAAVQQQRASLFPTVSLGLTGDRSGVRGQGSDGSYRLNLGGSWEPDVWGRLRAGVTSAQAGAQAGQARYRAGGSTGLAGEWAGHCGHWPNPGQLSRVPTRTHAHVDR